MKLIDFCVRYPVSVLVGVILLILFGAISMLRIPVQMTPTVDRPEITVETTYLGAAPAEVEKEVTDRLEEKLNSVEGLEEMTSTSAEGRSTIVLSFDWGTNKDVARLDVSEKRGLVKDLPDDADEPIIRAVNSTEEQPISWIAIETRRNLNEVRVEAEDVIQPRLERVPGVGAVSMFGGEEREVQVLLDPSALSARGLTIAQVRDALLRENRNVKGGNINEGKRRYVVRTVGQFTHLRPIENVIVARQDGAPVYLRDVAKVRFGYKDREFAVRRNGVSSIGFGAYRKTGANTLEVMEGLKREIAYLNDQLYKEKDIRLVQVYDETVYINDSIHLVLRNLVYGSILAVAVLLLFLKNPSSIFIIGFSIPISIVSTFILLKAFGRSLNTISLAGLAFASGMVVDNAIVVLENIFRHRQMGKSRFQAALDGAKEVWGAILASTLTTLAVFIPVILVEAEAGQLFGDIALTISIAVAFSLAVSVTVIPMLSGRILRLGRDSGARGGRILDWLTLGWLGRGFSRFVCSTVAWLVRGRLRSAAAILLITGASLGASYLLIPPIDYLPQGNQNLIFGLVKVPPGFNVDEKEAIIRELERRFMQIPELERVFSVIRTEDPIFVVIAKREFAQTPAQMQDVVAKVRRRSSGVPGAPLVFITQSSLFRRRGAILGGTNVDVYVKGNQMEEIQRISEEIQGGVARVPGVNFVNTSFELGNPELQIHVDPEKAADLGVSVAQVGYIVETLVKGTEAGKFRERGREIDITLKGMAGNSIRTQDLDNILLSTSSGRPIRLSSVAEVRPASGPTKIEHIDMDRSIHLTVNMRPDIPLEEAIRNIDRRVVAPIRARLPLGYTIDISGQAKDLKVTWDSLKWSFLLSLIVVYLLMCSLFESFTYPFIIMFSVPLAATGGILGVRLAHAFEPTIKMDVITMLGFIILAGIVVNNAILIVHQALNHMREGLPSREAILESLESRLRPIFMTVTTTVFGMLPVVASTGSGSELYRGLGSAILGGLICSTLFTLFLVPTLFSLWMTVKEDLYRGFGGRGRPRKTPPESRTAKEALPEQAPVGPSVSALRAAKPPPAGFA
ncbi:MAG: efflux RND transporter permease subunit [Candidatus Tectomicrobia bacterium]|nr:efflux RND transporter permease subunit [Candidatus Tectomicrobia bacterium]